MAHPTEREILRHLEMLARAKPSAESTERALNRVRMQLTAQSEAARPSPSPPTIHLLFRKPLLRIAAAAIVTVTVVLSVWFWDRQPGPAPDLAGAEGQTGQISPLPLPDPQSAQYVARVRQEALEIEALAAKQDTAGLLAFLSRALPETKVLIADSLKELDKDHLQAWGQRKIIPALMAEAQQWTGDATHNPFVSAAEQIQTQLAALAQTSDSGNTLELSTQPGLDVEPEDILSGRVLDAETGLPIADAWVEILAEVNFGTRTDAQGFYAMNARELKGNYPMRVAAQGYLIYKQDGKLPIVAIDPDAPVVRDFRLRPGCMVDVEVVNEAGQPVKDVQLLTSWLGSDHENDVAQPVGTDQDGRATVGAFEPSETVYMLTAMCDDFAPHHTNVKCSDPHTSTSVQIQLRAGQQVPGVARYEDGLPAQGLSIVAKPDWWQSKHWPGGNRVDDAGGFTLQHIVPGSYSIYALLPGQGYAMPMDQVRLPLQAGEVFELTVPRESPESLAELDLNMQWQGQTQPGDVWVLAYSLDDTYVFSRKQIKQGTPTFTIDGLTPGQYALYFDGPGIRQKIVKQVDVPGGPVDIVLEYHPAPTISGLVVAAATGEPIDSFEVGLMKLRRLGNVIIKPHELITPFVNAGGQYSVKTKEGTGTYQLRITADGYVPAWSGEINTDEDVFPIIEMVTGGRIQGRIVDENGRLVPGAKITQISSDALSQSARQGLIVQDERSAVTPDGRFGLDHVPEGLHRLTITAPQHTTQVLDPVEVTNGQTTEVPDIVLSSSSVVEGVVYDTEGRPEPEVALVVYDGSRPRENGHDQADQRLATAVTDAQGHYRIEGLPETLCYVERSKIDRSFGVVRRAIVPRKGQVYRLDMGQGTRVMGLLVLDGRAWANQRILLTDPEHPSTGAFQCYVQTDSVGAFVFRGVPVGRYAVYYSQGGALAQWIRVETVQIEREDIDMGVIPPALSTLAVELTSAASFNANDWIVWLQQGRDLLGSPVGQAVKVVKGRVVLPNVPLGRFTLVARNSQGRHVRQALEVTEPGAPIHITMTIPVGSASIGGNLQANSVPSLLLFNDDTSLIIRIDTTQSTYAITDLPAGHYYISNSVFTQSVPLTTFDLSPGQHRDLDIDTSNWLSLGQGLLSVEVLTDQGHPLSDAEVWLEAPEGQIRPLYRSPQEYVFTAPVGEYALHVTHPGFAPYQEAVSVIANDVIALYPERPVVRVQLQAQ